MRSDSLSNPTARWAVRGATLLLWALVAASAAYWILKFGRPAAAAPIAPPLRQVAAADPAAVARLLGATAPQAAAAAPVVSLASRFALVGVAAGRTRGAALIAVDGKPAKPFRVGSAVEEGLLLQSVQARSAVLAASQSGPAVLTLELPPLRR